MAQVLALWSSIASVRSAGAGPADVRTCAAADFTVFAATLPSAFMAAAKERRRLAKIVLVWKTRRRG
jgi:hypothetical protein